MTTSYGYAAANFSIAGTIDEPGSLFGSIYFNPGRLGKDLQRINGPVIRMRSGAARLTPKGCRFRRVEAQWPFIRMELADPLLGERRMAFKAWAPLREDDDGEISALPVLMAEVSIDSYARRDAAPLHLTVEGMHDADHFFFGWYDDHTGAALGQEVEVPEPSRKLLLVITHYDPERFLDARFADAEAIATAAVERRRELRTSTEAFENQLPVVPDPTVARYLRTMILPTIMRTKMTANGEVVTMGYWELAQRDSFWSSFTQLIYWPKLERRLIQHAVDHQRDDGKIPTCILPEIDREYDADVTAYFVLRMSRFASHMGDMEAVRDWMPATEKALEYLIQLAEPGKGLPLQVDWWHDWKDVPGVEGRQYSPYTCLLYLAALEETARLAAGLAMPQKAERWQELAQRGRELLDRPFAEGGLWNGRFYQQRWADGRDDGRLLIDQVVGILWGQMPEERARSVLNSLKETSHYPCGTSETWPWYSEDFGRPPGRYHNGGIWPWLVYAECWARFAAGDTHEARELLCRTAWADLERDGTHIPNEYMDATTGENLGHAYQAWNASFVGAVYWGMLRETGMPCLSRR